MTWLDLLVVFIVGLTIFIASHRGLIMEFFDLLIIVGAFILAIQAKNPLAGVFMDKLSWTPGLANWMGFMLVFVPVGVLIFLLGCYVKDSINAHTKVPLWMDQLFGVLFGTVKALFFGVMIVVLIGIIPNTSVTFRAATGKGFIVRQVDKLIPSLEQAVIAVSPKKTGKYLAGKIQAARFPTPENHLPNTGKTILERWEKSYSQPWEEGKVIYQPLIIKDSPGGGELIKVGWPEVYSRLKNRQPVIFLPMIFRQNPPGLGLPPFKLEALIRQAEFIAFEFGGPESPFPADILPLSPERRKALKKMETGSYRELQELYLKENQKS